MKAFYSFSAWQIICVTMCSKQNSPKCKKKVPLKYTAVIRFLLNSLQSAEEIIVCVSPSKVSFIYVSSFLIHRKHQEDCWQIINQVHSWHKARHQDWQDRGPRPGKPSARLILTGRCAAMTLPLLQLQGSTWILQTKQSYACIMHVQHLWCQLHCIVNGPVTVSVIPPPKVEFGGCFCTGHRLGTDGPQTGCRLGTDGICGGAGGLLGACEPPLGGRADHTLRFFLCGFFHQRKWDETWSLY